MRLANRQGVLHADSGQPKFVKCRFMGHAISAEKHVGFGEWFKQLEIQELEFVRRES